MAAYVSVPRDLSRVKTKIIFNLTKRQLICFSIAAAIGIPIFFLIKKTGNISLAALGMIAVMMPFFFLAMYERDGMPLEVYLGYIMEWHRRPKVRPYEIDNYYSALLREADAEEDVKRIVRNAETKTERKAKAGRAASEKRR
jgi:hypothetical protein